MSPMQRWIRHDAKNDPWNPLHLAERTVRDSDGSNDDSDDVHDANGSTESADAEGWSLHVEHDSE